MMPRATESASVDSRPLSTCRAPMTKRPAMEMRTPASRASATTTSISEKPRSFRRMVLSSSDPGARGPRHSHGVRDHAPLLLGSLREADAQDRGVPSPRDGAVTEVADGVGAGGRDDPHALG